MGEPSLAAHPHDIDHQQLTWTFARQFTMDDRIEYATKPPPANDPAVGGDDLLADRTGVEFDCRTGLRKPLGGGGFDKGPGPR